MESAAESWNITHKRKRHIMGWAWCVCFNSKTVIHWFHYQKNKYILWGLSHLLSHRRVINKVKSPLQPFLNIDACMQMLTEIVSLWLCWGKKPITLTHLPNAKNNTIIFSWIKKMPSFKCIWKKCMNYFNWHTCWLGEIEQVEVGD